MGGVVCMIKKINLVIPKFYSYQVMQNLQVLDRVLG